MIDCLHFQSQLLSRLNSLRPEASLSGAYADDTAVPSKFNEAMCTREHAKLIAKF